MSLEFAGFSVDVLVNGKCIAHGHDAKSAHAALINAMNESAVKAVVDKRAGTEMVVNLPFQLRVWVDTAMPR